MKLFQRLLVASTAMSLIAPVAAQASDTLNLEEMNLYTRNSSSSKKQKISSKTFANELATVSDSVKNVEAQNYDFEAGGFSETTSLDGKVVFSIGALEQDDGNLNEATRTMYMWQGNLNTSFTGDDNLYVRLKTGNAAGWQKAYTYGTYLSSAKGNSNEIKVDKIWYSFPVGDNNTVWIGPKIENYYMHATTPSIYKPTTKQFTLGGNGAAYGASTNPGIGWAYKADNGFAISSNVVSKEADESTGFLTDESATSWATQVGYTQPQYAASVMVNMKYNGWADSYYTTPNGKLRPGDGNSTNIGLRGWWRPAESGTATPEVSLGYDVSDTDDDTNSETTAWFAGLTWTNIFNPDDRIGAAFGQPQTREDEDVDPFAWETYYSFAVNDSVTNTVTIFGGSDRGGEDSGDHTGAVFETTFKF